MLEMIALADCIVVMNGYRVAGDLHNSRDHGAMSEDIMNLIHKLDAA